MSKKDRGIRSRLKSFNYAFQGFITLLRNEPNSGIHAIAAILAVIAGYFLKLSTIEWVIIFIVIGLVFIAELINSAIEKIADMIEPEIDPGIKQIKDYAAASVLMSAIIAVVAGGLIFIPKLIQLL